MTVHKQIGRIGLTITLEKKGDAYGKIGARSFVAAITAWVNPK